MFAFSYATGSLSEIFSGVAHDKNQIPAKDVVRAGDHGFVGVYQKDLYSHYLSELTVNCVSPLNPPDGAVPNLIFVYNRKISRDNAILVHRKNTWNRVQIGTEFPRFADKNLPYGIFDDMVELSHDALNDLVRRLLDARTVPEKHLEHHASSSAQTDAAHEMYERASRMVQSLRQIKQKYGLARAESAYLSVVQSFHSDYLARSDMQMRKMSVKNFLVGVCSSTV